MPGEPVAPGAGWFAAPARSSWRCSAGAARSGRLLPPSLVTGVVGADLGVNNGPNESTALSPQLYDVLRPETHNETDRGPEAADGAAGGFAAARPGRTARHGLRMAQCRHGARLRPYAGLQPAAAGRFLGSGRHARRHRRARPSASSRRCSRPIAAASPICWGCATSPRRCRSSRSTTRCAMATSSSIARTKDGYIYENPRALPRVQFVGGWELADFDGMKQGGQLAGCRSAAGRAARGRAAAGDARGAGAGARPTSSCSRYENTEVEIEVTTAAAGFVVLNDIWHPWWRAEIDGAETEILKANVLFRAVQVPAGTHKIRFSFHPVEGALAELRERVSPQEPEDDLPLPPDEPRWRRARASCLRPRCPGRRRRCGIRCASARPRRQARIPHCIGDGALSIGSARRCFSSSCRA